MERSSEVAGRRRARWATTWFGSSGLPGSISGKITSRMLALATVPLLVVGLVTAVTSVVLAGRVDDRLEESRRVLLEEAIGQSRSEQADDLLARMKDFVDDRFEDVVDWTRAGPVSTAAAANRPEIAEFVGESVEAVEARFDGTKLLDESGESSAYLRSEISDRLFYAEVFFTDANGFNVGATNPTSDFVQRDEGWWQDAWRDGAFLGPLEFDESAGVRSFEVAVRIDDRSTGQPLGVMKAVVDASSLFGLADSFADDRESQLREVRIMAVDGTLIAETSSGHDPARVGQQVVLEGDQAQAFALSAQSDQRAGFLVLDDTVVGFGRTGPSRSVDRVNAVVANHNWIVMIDQPKEVALAPLAGLDELGSELDRSAVITIVLLIGMIVVTLALAAVVSQLLARRIAAPIDQLRDEANRVAEEELPELVARLRVPGTVGSLPVVDPIEIDAEGEVAELAYAFNSVRSMAVELAGGQALGRSRDVANILVNLGRRNQQLVGRQLQFIDRLERSESNPDTLQNLFQLDQMATRMRRNAESLLVLAGHVSPGGGSGPISVEDVLRAASGEVEDFSRVRISSVEPDMVHALVANDLTHLLAELIENAVRFSPPDSMVDVVGFQGPGDGYTISVVDSGIGMTRAELDEANARLLEPTFTEDSPSGLLGLYVVGRLAGRHGIDARLIESATVGLTAKLTLPGSCLTDAVAPPVPEVSVDRAPTPQESRASSLADHDTVPDPDEAPIPPFRTRTSKMPPAQGDDENPSSTLQVRRRARREPSDLSAPSGRGQAADVELSDDDVMSGADSAVARAEYVREQLSRFAKGVDAGLQATKGESMATPASDEEPSIGGETSDASSVATERAATGPGPDVEPDV